MPFIDPSSPSPSPFLAPDAETPSVFQSPDAGPTGIDGNGNIKAPALTDLEGQPDIIAGKHRRPFAPHHAQDGVEHASAALSALLDKDYGSVFDNLGSVFGDALLGLGSVLEGDGSTDNNKVEG